MTPLIVFFYSTVVSTFRAVRRWNQCHGVPVLYSWVRDNR